MATALLQYDGPAFIVLSGLPVNVSIVSLSLYFFVISLEHVLLAIEYKTLQRPCVDAIFSR